MLFAQSLDTAPHQTHLPHYYRAFLRNFRKTASFFVLFHLLFASLLCIETLTFFFLLRRHSLLLVLILGALLLTSFTYAILLFYYQSKKPEQLQRLTDQFIASCRPLLPMPLALADALLKLATYLQGFESNFYSIPTYLQPLAKLIQRCSTYCYSRDVFQIQQLLLLASVKEHLEQIRLLPTDLEVHASLATHYIALSRLYKPHPSLEEKFRLLARFAMEEFHILQQYAPNDPWVHEQLATGYRDLEMPDEEIKEIEILSQLRPQDHDILFRLGTLYFQQGRSAKGLQTYETLKRSNYAGAETLLSLYNPMIDGQSTVPTMSPSAAT